METDAYIALGSNLGDRELNLLRAVGELGKIPGSRVTGLSRFYETSPVGMPSGTPAFYNGVARLRTTQTPHDLLTELQRIERAIFGRTPAAEPQSRRLDLDLLLYGTEQLSTPDLTLPHPRMTARRFVLLPLADIAPTLREPVSKQTIADLLTSLTTDEQVSLLE
ncbi:MAG: 2-amino-4-hydroxy-6-hydroxymethyldihydropteridine diphosphokinase [Trichlorobacter sp.]|uniref:2-amino-4-hydroxy-6- hydroxymethyldihydropteridine diphosphokinase n=1 Tax=Trichlorobacter sp. TaxID=2911007 RepID=UPI00255D6F0F|nr:2-amino-4-hydroxy-6-hydroxymethyldihydropteridine diphosphokinase [Trichlorobacter sp.]